MRYVIIVAGGTGKRMGSELPKQFIELSGKPILMRTIERFHSFDKLLKIIVVLPEQQRSSWDELIDKHNFSIKHLVTNGGDTRFASVKNGLKLVDNNGIIAIHDGVRPLVSNDVIKRCFDMAERCGNAIPAIELVDSVRLITDEGSAVLDRQRVKLIQTPQIFDGNLIKKAYEQEYRSSYTDDATVLESMNIKINLVDGNRENIKITTPVDLVIAEAFIKIL